MAAVAPSLTHAQYNSPMPLYSKDNVKDVLQQTQDFIQHNRPQSAASGQFNPSQSGAYRLLQETGQIAAAAPSHSARLDEQSDEYPHYRGFVDPRVQSPSFKRLQYVTAMDSGAEDDISQELHAPVQSRTDDARSRSATREPDYSYNHQPQQPQWEETVSGGGGGGRGPRIFERDPASEDTGYGEGDRATMDPVFADRIAEAERPKVPPKVVPAWARKAEEKREKWQQHGDRYQERSYEYQPPVAIWQKDAGHVKSKWEQIAPPSSRSKSAEPSRRTWTAPVTVATEERRQQQQYHEQSPATATTKFAPPTQPSYSPLSSYSRPAVSKPQEYSGGPTTTPRPYSSQSTGGGSSSVAHQQREYTTTSFGGGGGGGNPGRYHQDYSAPAPAPAPANPTVPRKEVNLSTLVSGEALKPGPHPPVVPAWSKHAEYKRTVWESKRSAVDPDYHRRQLAGEPPPPWAGKAERTHSLWQNEADAWQRQRQYHSGAGGGNPTRAVSAGPPNQQSGGYSGGYSGSTNPLPSWRQPQQQRPAAAPVQQRQWQQQPAPEQSGGGGRYSAGSGSAGSAVVPSWRQRPVPHEASPRAGTGGTGGIRGSPVPIPITYQPQQSVNWQPAPGGETKSQSSGTYYDPAGNRVSYKKEAYTKSDQSGGAGGGADYSSILSEEEKRQIVGPGAGTGTGGGIGGELDVIGGGEALGPGVASRHVTRKYYKKTTRTTSTTTNTSGGGPPAGTTSTTVTYEYPPPPAAGRRHVDAGVTEY